MDRLWSLGSGLRVIGLPVMLHATSYAYSDKSTTYTTHLIIWLLGTENYTSLNTLLPIGEALATPNYPRVGLPINGCYSNLCIIRAER